LRRWWSKRCAGGFPCEKAISVEERWRAGDRNHAPAAAIAASPYSSFYGFRCYPLFEREPFLDNVRTDPGFVAFMREQKVQWEQFRTTL
jgi:mannose-6-phosphate isomerase class I